MDKVQEYLEKELLTEPQANWALITSLDGRHLIKSGFKNEAEALPLAALIVGIASANEGLSQFLGDGRNSYFYRESENSKVIFRLLKKKWVLAISFSATRTFGTLRFDLQKKILHLWELLPEGRISLNSHKHQRV